MLKLYALFGSIAVGLLAVNNTNPVASKVVQPYLDLCDLREYSEGRVKGYISEIVELNHNKLRVKISGYNGCDAYITDKQSNLKDLDKTNYSVSFDATVQGRRLTNVNNILYEDLTPHGIIGANKVHPLTQITGFIKVKPKYLREKTLYSIEIINLQGNKKTFYVSYDIAKTIKSSQIYTWWYDNNLIIKQVN